MIEAVFFDLDDTLCNSASAFANALAETFAELHPHTPADLHEAWRAVHRPLLEDLDAGLRNMAETRERRMRDVLAHLGVPDDRLADEANLKIAHRYLDGLRLFDDVEILETLRAKGLYLGIVTNGAADAHPDSQQTKIERLGLQSRLDSFCISDATGFRKPRPEAFDAALRAANCRPEQALFVGDSLDNDIAGANAAGIPSVLIARSADLPREKFNVRPHHVVTSLREVARLIA